jgi:hypothetical protein
MYHYEPKHDIMYQVHNYELAIILYKKNEIPEKRTKKENFMK